MPVGMSPSWRPLLLTLLLATSASGQTGRASLSGQVRDTNRAPVPLVRVTAAGTTAITDSSGRFAFSGLSAGPARVSARRLGFLPQDVAVQLADGRADTLTIVLVLVPRDLPGITTEAHTTGRLGDFNRHRTNGMGMYLDRKQLEERRTNFLSDIMRRVSGVRILTDRTGRTHIRMDRAGGVRDCPPDFWVDGIRAQMFGVDDIPVGDIEALEVYRGPSGLPPEFNTRSGNPNCGAVVIWTRVPG